MRCEICGLSKSYCSCKKKVEFFEWYKTRSFFDITAREGIFIIYCLMFGFLLGFVSFFLMSINH